MLKKSSVTFSLPVLVPTALLASLVAASVLVADAPRDASSPPSLFAPSKTAGDTPAVPTRDAQPTAERSPAQAEPQDERPYVMRLEVTAQPGQSLEDAYFEYFSKNRVHPKVVRATVRRLGSQKKFEEGVAVMRAALRSGQVQSWMYEGLGLMMELAKMPRDEIERTLMSAVDFATSPQELIHIADFLDQMKFTARALEVLKVVSEKAPGMTDSYVRALRLAQHTNVDEAIQWSSLGILRQEWPASERKIRDDARRAALALIEEMRGRGENEAADRFAQQVKDALHRDVVVRVSWAGDADVDLMVEEPAGSVCSFRHPRTGGGGVLVGDPHTELDRSAGEGFMELYACAEGFSGSYRVLLRQVWGRIPAGRVTVDVWTHGGTNDQVFFHKVVPLDEEKSALVTFDLENGRRTESLEQNQLANDMTTQLAANRAVLAQQIASISSDRAIRAQQVSSRSQAPFVVTQTPPSDPSSGPSDPSHRINRPVGFRPEIIVLPIGATMSVNAVISADRRYVRTTALPFFSNIKAVTQFNLTTGVTDRDSDFATADIDIGANP